MAVSSLLVVWLLVTLAEHGWSVRAAFASAMRGRSEAERWGADANGFYGNASLPKELIGAVPISVRVDQNDPWASPVTLCKLDIEARRADPAAIPMFRFWVSRSNCNQGKAAGEIGHTATMTLGQLKAHLERTEVDWVQRFGSNKTGAAVWRPHGLVFHEARVGSTLVANMLQALPNAVTYSESAPPADIVFRAEGWPRLTRVEALRVLVRAMGRIPHAELLFFKFQSAITGSADLVRQAFPDTPFIFLKRDPVEVMASLLGTYADAMRRGADTGAVIDARATPCTRTIRSPPGGMAAALGVKSEAELGRGGTASFCAAHIGFVEYKAAKTLDLARAGVEKRLFAGAGAAVDYAELPGIVPRVARELFGVAVDTDAEAAMLHAAESYSKGTNKRSSTSSSPDGKFKDDSEAKRATAPERLKEAADRFVAPQRPKVERHTLDAAIELVKGAHRMFGPEETAPQLNEKVKKMKAKQAAGGAASRGGATALGRGSLVSLGQAEDGEEVLLDGEGNSTEDYPRLFPLPDILDAWSVDEPRVPEDYGKFASLRVFDFTDAAEVEAAETYRMAEVPFVARGIPNLIRLRDEWTDQFLERQLPGTRHTEISPTNHFMYFNRGGGRRGGASYPIQTRDARKSYIEWIAHAKEVDKKVLSGEAENRKTEHWYFRASSKHAREGKNLRGSENGFITEGYRIFDATSTDNGDEQDIAKSGFFIVDKNAQRGIHCRFGEAGIVAEAHYDAGRNFISMARGRKRYILSPPSECPHYNLLFDGPSARHSRSDWGKPEDYRVSLANAKALEIVIEAGDALYVPSFWFHLPISLETNIQCNTRSGSPPEGAKDIETCGFRVFTSEGGAVKTVTPVAKAGAPDPHPTPAPRPAA